MAITQRRAEIEQMGSGGLHRNDRTSSIRFRYNFDDETVTKVETSDVITEEA